MAVYIIMAHGSMISYSISCGGGSSSKAWGRLNWTGSISGLHYSWPFDNNKHRSGLDCCLHLVSGDGGIQIGITR